MSGFGRTARLIAVAIAVVIAFGYTLIGLSRIIPVSGHTASLSLKDSNDCDDSEDCSDDDDDHSGPGNGADDDSTSGSGGGNGENSGHGSGDDDEDNEGGTVGNVTIPDGAFVVRIVDRQFSPSRITVAPGQPIVFVNEDDDEHTATGRGFDTGVMPEGGSATVTLDEAGTYPFVCQFHAEMHGEIVVGDGAATPAASPVASPVASPGATLAPGNTAKVDIVDFAFSPDVLTVPVGTTVTWTNTGVAIHTVTGDWGGSDTLDAAFTYSFTFTEPGTYSYVCDFHPQMTGTIIVQ